jgi:methylenetetrahydrofolate dehydrogenase (NADP+)/methenyltetrahydrofolate cyclohydrolase
MSDPARLIDGKAHAQGLRNRVAEEVRSLKAATGSAPGLAVVLVGDDPASQVYVRSKHRQAQEAGMASFEIRLPADTGLEAVLAEVERLNADPAVHGILVQLPLPGGLDESRVVNAIRPEKDVDGLTVASAGRLALGIPGPVACTPLGSLMLIKSVLGQDLSGNEAVVLGRSILVGRPMAQLLLGENCTVTLAHSRTRDVEAVCRRADILVAAVGRPQMIKGSWIKPGATVIDVGINRVPAADPAKTRLVGDVDFDEARQVAGAITPVPGGVGPMTVACLLHNTVLAAAIQTGLDPVEIGSRMARAGA